MRIHPNSSILKVRMQTVRDSCRSIRNRFRLSSENVALSGEFDETTFEPCTSEESEFLIQIGFHSSEIKIKTSVSVIRKVPNGVISFIPIRRNTETGKFEKLVNFKVKVNSVALPTPPKSDHVFAENSVLATGDWYKLKITQTGIYKITYNDLVSYGIDPASIDPHNIKIYGNGGGALPELNSDFRYDDLQENSITVFGEEDGSFDPSDYILFYGMNPNTWEEVLGFFTYVVDYYEDYNYYFLTVSSGNGKRVTIQPSTPTNPVYAVTRFNDYQVVEDEKTNLIQSGKEWYGDEFGEVLSRQYNFNFPEIVINQPVVIKIEMANRTYINEAMIVKINGEIFDTITLTSIPIIGNTYARKKKTTITYIPSGPDLQITLEYQPSSTDSRAWLDYIMINAKSQLKLVNGQLLFRDLSSIHDGAITKFDVANSNDQTKVWEVTDPINPKVVESTLIDNDLFFVLPTDHLREFDAFDGSMFYTPEFIEHVPNQNLHAAGPADMVIVTHPLFLEQANELANLHDSLDGFKMVVATTDQIYNEFASGKKDPTAIRDFMKLLYDGYPGNEPRFLLLFGDGSYDPKDRLPDNSDFIPTFQTEESWTTTYSYVVDDYYGLLDDNEGSDSHGNIDIGIGRFPVETADDANIVLNKIKNYISNKTDCFGNWRLKVCVIADDEDGNLHLDQADSVATYIPELYNQKKIYLDSYPQEKTPSGDKYPGVTIDINKQVNDGALLVNYVGHGGVYGWAHEQVTQIPDILAWKNKNHLPVFVTATCEFSRFDDPEFRTAGEIVLMNPDGGGVALFTTTRVAFSLSNFSLNLRLFSRAFVPGNDGEMPRLGDLIEYSKPPGQLSTRNFILLGDPALKMAYPRYMVRTTGLKINHDASPNDTIKALDLVELTGEITDQSGQTMEDFNGSIYPVLYDKPTKYTTIANDATSLPTSYYCQDKIVWQGRSSVTNGSFSFSFFVPKDIELNYGTGKISYYAKTAQTDAAGFYDNFIFGNLNQNAEIDTQGPDINLYMNDPSFVSGDQTTDSPIMMANIQDDHGINLSVNGIGHNITAVLDENYEDIINLNKYFVPDADTYKGGSITFPFSNLPDGKHTLTLKAWDVYNNSGTATIEFVINSGAALNLTQVMNYPNPFNESTMFTFNHTRPGEKLHISLEIFDMTGRKVFSWSNSVLSKITTTAFLEWDGKDATGNKLGGGLYLYTVTVKDEKGMSTTQQQKLMIMN